MCRLKYERIFQILLLACLAYTQFAHAQANIDPQNSILSLNVSNTPDGRQLLTINMKHAPVLPQDFTIASPPRIAFDFPNTDNESGKSSFEFNQGNFRSLNIVQAASRTRLVVNLSQAIAYSTRVDGNNLLVTLGNVSKTTPVSRFAEAIPSSHAQHSLRNIGFHRGNNGEGRIEVAMSDSNTGIDIHQQGKKIIVDFMDTTAPSVLQHKLDVTDFGTPIKYIDTFTQGDNVRMEVEPTGLWEQSAYQADNKFVLEIKKKIEEEAGKREGKRTYTGDKLTLNFQNIQVREALNVIADFTGLNIVISDSVNGNLTLRLKDVPWDQALDIILQSKGLDMRKNGNVIQIAPREEIAARDKVAMTAAQDVEDLEPLRTESFMLSYQKGSDIVSLITNKDQRILSKRGSAVVDKRTNTVFVQDTPSRLDDVRNLIKQIDVPVRQVMIEARFVSAGTQFNRDIGGKLSYIDSGTSSFHLPNGQLAGSVTAAGVSLPISGAAVANGLTLSMFNPSATRVLNLELDASEIDGTTKNIASPRVVTADKTAASISSGTQIPYQQATSSGATNVAFKDATLSLTVTPQITPDDNIDMNLQVNQDTVGATLGGGTGVPSIDTKKVSTEVLVENGGTVVIGGVYTQDISDSTTKVPLFGDIPLIGWLFKSRVKSDNKNELLVFITPRILKDSLNLD
jgi:type IV pilus assembly protein PilQ